MNKSDPSQNDGPASVIVLLPTDDDPIRTIASGDHPHTTLLYLGDESTDVEALQRVVKEAAVLRSTMPASFDHISGEGTLGEDKAHVYFLAAQFSSAIRDILLEQPLIIDEVSKQEQFPAWTPHTTIGYPDAPAVRAVRPEGVVYDRLAIMHGGEVTEFPLVFPDDSDSDESIVASAVADVEPPEDEEEAQARAELIALEEEGFAVPWHGILAPEGVPSSDGRMFSNEGMTMRGLPLPLRHVISDVGAHDGAVIVGNITEVHRTKDGLLKASGFFDDSPAGYEAIRQMANGMLRGVSVDVTSIVAEENADGTTTFSDATLAAATLVAIPAFPQAYVALGEWESNSNAKSDEDFASTDDVEAFVGDKLLPKHMDAPGWITDPRPTKRITSYWVDGVGAAKIKWGPPGDFNRCRRQLGKYVKNPDWLAGLCFTGDTEFTTADGVMTFEEAAGTAQKVLTSADPTGEKGSGQKRKGRWVEAPIESFGEHEVMTVRLRRNRTVKEVRATRNHIWFAQEHPNNLQNSPMKQVKTEDLRPGSVLASLMPEATVAKGRSAPSPIGISAGMVFGDGTAAKDNTGASIDLWGEKDANLLPYFSMQSMKDRTNVNGLPGKRVYGLPNSWKRPPQLDEGFSYLYGWLAGYFAADGSVTKRGAASISSANKEHLEYAATVARKLGISVQPIGKQMRKGKGAEETPLYKLGFVGNTLHEDFFIIPEHRENWAGVPHSRSAVRWTVEEVVETGEVEEVFCAVVPETENFVLTDTIWVHNCANLHHRATGSWPGQHSAMGGIIASASPSVFVVDAPALPKREWFEDPKLAEVTPITVTEDGRVFGHLADWQTCHVGFADVCRTAPPSMTNYAYFRTGEMDTDGGPVHVGQIVMGGDHAGLRADLALANKHYASTSAAVADVAVGEDVFGIWVAGSLREGANPRDVATLKKSQLSGDWRTIRTKQGQASLELIAALAVNNPGFPIRRVRMATQGRQPISLIASAAIPDRGLRSERLANARAALRSDRLTKLRAEFTNLEGV